MRKKHTVTLSDGGVVIDGEPMPLRSGALHYFRIHPGQWADRLKKARQLGLNTVETYLCWNLHEPHPGVYDFSGGLDLVRFIRLAGEAGLRVVLRPGPYICAEWENGGLPAWLSIVPGIRMRRMNAPYLEASDRWFRKLLPLLAPGFATNGGPVVAVQLENEYGNYCEDKEYLRHLLALFTECGVDVPMFTADNGYTLGSIRGGSLPELPALLTFGPDADARCLERLRMLRPGAPLRVMEFWVGMFDSCGCPHRTIPIAPVAETLDRICAQGGAFNLYMLCGGTNFGFQSGANLAVEWTDNGRRLTDRSYCGMDYTPHTTSYDYDAPLDEAGDPTPKYFAIQEVLRRHFPDAEYGTPVPAPKGDYGAVELTAGAGLFDNLGALGKCFHTADAECMETLGQNYGFLLYRTRIASPWIPEEDTVFLREVRDRAMVYFNGRYLGCVERNTGNRIFELPDPEQDGELAILVENQGRVNYGPAVGRELKGLPGGVSMVMKSLREFDTYTLELEDISGLRWGAVEPVADCPRFYRGTFEIAGTPLDTWLKSPGRRGLAWVNGFLLGRYREDAPSDSLYVPAPVLKTGVNEVVIFELHDLPEFRVEFKPERLWRQLKS